MNTTLETGLQVLEFLWSSKTPQGVSELARGLGKGKSNVHRVLTTLSDHGFVYRDGTTRKYQPGPGWVYRPDEARKHAACRPDAAVWWD